MDSDLPKKTAAAPMGGRDIAGKDMAYVTLLEGPRDGREKSGWYLGLAVRDEPGYHQLKPGFGPYEGEDDAKVHALSLNTKLGHDEESAFLVVLSSMAGPGAVRR
jgi:hypothetical protein